jgi:SAM-dependent methyltransferase
VLGIGEGVPAGEGARGVLHARVLDTGCGYGRHLVPLLECGVSVVGYDLSVFMLGEAAKGIRGGSERNPSIGRRAGARPVRSPGPPVLPFIRLRDQHVQLLRVFRQGGG